MLATLSTMGLTLAFSGWLVRPLSWPERGILVLGALLTVWPTAVDAVDLATLSARAVGIVLLILTTLRLSVATPAAAQPLSHEPTSI